jgi:hypothetical protein
LTTAAQAIEQMTGGRPAAPVKRSPIGWLVFAIVLLLFIAAPAYLIYQAVQRHAEVQAPGPDEAISNAVPPPLPAGVVPATRPAVRRRGNRRPIVTGPITDSSVPLIDAIRKNDSAKALSLIAAGADVSAVEPDQLHFTPLLAAAIHNRDTMLPVVKTLVEHGAPVNARAPYGFSAIMLAARHHSPQTVEFLLAHGADTSFTTKKGETALDWAREYHETAIAAILEKAGAKPGTPPPPAPSTPIKR